MSHVDDGRLNALLDGELDAAEAEAVRAHIADCAECARRLEEAKQFLAGAADLLGALDLPVSASAPAAPARRVSKTAREVAIDIDGATHKSPAIRPNLPEAAPAPAPRRRFDYTALSWAAVVVLAVGVVYLANEVRRMGRETHLAEGAPAAAAPAAPAAPNAAELGRGGTSKGAAPGRGATAPAAHPPHGAAPHAAPNRTATAAGKRLVAAKAAAHRPTQARAQAGELASTAAPQTAGAGGAAGLAAPAPTAPAAPAANRPTARAADRTVAGVAAPPAPVPAFHRVALEEAVAHLNGVIRLMDGMRFVEVELGSGNLVPGADRDRELVRLVYYDSTGRRLVLDQQRVSVPALGGVVSPDIGMRPGDTLTTATPEGEVRVRWISGTFWLSLTGNLPPDELKRMTERVR